MVYSAYYDVRMPNKPIIRVFGVTGSMNPEKVLCRLYYDYKRKNFESKNDDINEYQEETDDELIDDEDHDIRNISGM